MAVLFGNDALSIIVLFTKKQYSSFFEKSFRFAEKSVFKVKVIKTFKISIDCHISLFWKSLVPFLEESMLFLLALKWNL